MAMDSTTKQIIFSSGHHIKSIPRNLQFIGVRCKAEGRQVVWTPLSNDAVQRADSCFSTHATSHF